MAIVIEIPSRMPPLGGLTLEAAQGEATARNLGRLRQALEKAQAIQLHVEFEATGGVWVTTTDKSLRQADGTPVEVDLHQSMTWVSMIYPERNNETFRVSDDIEVLDYLLWTACNNLQGAGLDAKEARRSAFGTITVPSHRPVQINLNFANGETLSRTLSDGELASPRPRASENKDPAPTP